MAFCYRQNSGKDFAYDISVLVGCGAIFATKVVDCIEVYDANKLLASISHLNSCVAVRKIDPHISYVFQFSFAEADTNTLVAFLWHEFDTSSEHTVCYGSHVVLHRSPSVGLEVSNRGT